MKYLDLDLLENPYGARRGSGYDSVLVGPGGGRVHVKGKDGGPLCMQGRSKRDVRDSSARVVTCYRCIKIMMMEGNAPFVMRDLTTARGVKRKHLMVPGGREGQMVAQREKHLSPFGLDGAEPFKRGPANHPTQGRLTKRIALARTTPGSIREEGVARPAYYVPPELRGERKAYVEELVKDVKRGQRRMAEKQRKAAKAAAAAAAAAEKVAAATAMEQAEMERMAGYANNPLKSKKKSGYGRHAFRFGGSNKDEALAKRLVRARAARSLPEAREMVLHAAGSGSSLAKAVRFVQQAERAREEAEMERLRGHANPATGRHARHGLPYMTFGNPGGWAWTVHATSPSAPPLDGSGTASSRESAVAAIKRFLSDYGDDYDTKKIKLVTGKARASGEEMLFLSGPTGKARGIATVEPVQMVSNSRRTNRRSRR